MEIIKLLKAFNNDLKMNTPIIPEDVYRDMYGCWMIRVSSIPATLFLKSDRCIKHMKEYPLSNLLPFGTSVITLFFH